MYFFAISIIAILFLIFLLYFDRIQTKKYEESSDIINLLAK